MAPRSKSGKHAKRKVGGELQFPKTKIQNYVKVHRRSKENVRAGPRGAVAITSALEFLTCTAIDIAAVEAQRRKINPDTNEYEIDLNALRIALMRPKNKIMRKMFDGVLPVQPLLLRPTDEAVVKRAAEKKAAKKKAKKKQAAAAAADDQE